MEKETKEREIMIIVKKNKNPSDNNFKLHFDKPIKKLIWNIHYIDDNERKVVDWNSIIPYWESVENKSIKDSNKDKT